MSKDSKQATPRKKDRRDGSRRKKETAFNGQEKRNMDNRLWDRRKEDRAKDLRPKYKD